ncbi:HAMP domain-containing protein [bacterium]|nr:HAMP domain-containing protein [bacterium]
MKLGAKLVLPLTLLFIISLAGIITWQRTILVPVFDRLEHAAAGEDMQRCVDAIEREVAHIALLAGDWAAWDDTYAFIRDNNADYRESNLTEETFTNARIDVLLFIDQNGVLKDRFTQHDGNEVFLRAVATPFFPPDHPFMKTPSLTKPATGILVTRHGPLIWGSRDIVTSKSEGPSRGRLLMGRFLDEKEVKRLQEQTRVDFVVTQTTAADYASAVASEGFEPPEVASFPMKAEESRHVVTHFMRDLDGVRGLELRAFVPYEITTPGFAAVNTSLLFTAGISALALITVLAVLFVLVIRPIARLTREVTRIGRESDFSAKVPADRKDELGRLGSEFNGMLKQLAESRAQLAEASRRVGMSDIAASVMHNIGNALNGLTVSYSSVTDRIRDSRIDKLEGVAKLIADHEADLADFLSRDERGRQVPAYLSRLTAHLRDENRATLAELETSGKNLTHIRELLIAQSALATGEKSTQEITPRELVDVALAIVAASFVRHGIELECVFETNDPVRVDRLKFSQLLINLLVNAKDAVVDHRTDGRKVTIRVEGGESARLRISVIDNGKGIEKDLLTRIFASGFTTKEGGKGIGLHYSALAAIELGGELRAASDGPGMGASFVIDIPVGAQSAGKAA